MGKYKVEYSSTVCERLRSWLFSFLCITVINAVNIQTTFFLIIVLKFLVKMILHINMPSFMEDILSCQKHILPAAGL